jgi:hypothetical protein
MTNTPPSLTLRAVKPLRHQPTPQQVVGNALSATDNFLAAIIVGACALAFVAGAALATVFAMIGGAPT